MNIYIYLYDEMDQIVEIEFRFCHCLSSNSPNSPNSSNVSGFRRKRASERALLLQLVLHSLSVAHSPYRRHKRTAASGAQTANTTTTRWSPTSPTSPTLSLTFAHFRHCRRGLLPAARLRVCNLHTFALCAAPTSRPANSAQPTQLATSARHFSSS